MKLSKVKPVCTKAESIQLIAPKIPENMITQWVGAKNIAFYSIPKIHLTPAELGALWDINADKLLGFVTDKSMDWLEPSLARVPAMADQEAAERKIKAYDFGSYYVLVNEQDKKVFLLDATYVKPCVDPKSSVYFVELPDFDMMSSWIGVYSDGVLMAVVESEPDDVVSNMIGCIKSIVKTYDAQFDFSEEN